MKKKPKATKPNNPETPKWNFSAMKKTAYELKRIKFLKVVVSFLQIFKIIIIMKPKATPKAGPPKESWQNCAMKYPAVIFVP